MNTLSIKDNAHSRTNINYIASLEIIDLTVNYDYTNKDSFIKNDICIYRK